MNLLMYLCTSLIIGIPSTLACLLLLKMNQVFSFAGPVAHEFIYLFTYANECFYHTVHIANVLPLVLYVTAK